MFSQSNHFLQGLAVLFCAVPVPVMFSVRMFLNDVGVEIAQYLRGYLEFPQVSEVALSFAPFSQYAVPRSDPR